MCTRKKCINVKIKLHIKVHIVRVLLHSLPWLLFKNQTSKITPCTMLATQGYIFLIVNGNIWSGYISLPWPWQIWQRLWRLNVHKLSPIAVASDVSQKQGDLSCYYLVNQKGQKPSMLTVVALETSCSAGMLEVTTGSRGTPLSKTGYWAHWECDGSENCTGQHKVSC